MKIGYFADGIWSHLALQKITKDERFEIAFIVPRYNSVDSVLREWATQLGVDFFTFKNVNSASSIEKLQEYKADIFVSMSFDQILKRDFLKCPKFGVINCHAGALPFYRGRNVLNWVLINGSSDFGVTVHYVDECIDTGDIILQKQYRITDSDTYGTILERASIACAEILHESLVKIYNGAVEPIPQSTDEQIRHAITKFAQWHFVAAEPYRQRVIQLGESPQRVFNLGAPGLDHLGRLDWCDRPTLEQFLGIKLLSPIFLVTYHPVTLDEQSPAIAMGELLTALDAFPQATVILTYPNADTGGRVLIEQIDQWVNSNQHRAKVFVSLGQQRYLSLMREADVIVGNSSSGITEAPALKKATVNIGDRQKGRLKAKSIIDVSEDSTSIMDAIHQALSPKFQSLLPSVQSWYGSGNVSYKIKETLKTFTPQTQKSFFDIDHV